MSPPSSGDFALYLYGTANTYSGSTVIGNGSNLAYLVPAGENSLSANSAVTVDAGSVLALDAPTSPSPTTTIPSLDGGGEVVNNGASPVETLTIAGSAAGNFTGQVLGTSGQDVALVMSGGTQTLGGADTYGGGTTISGGTLTVSAANNLGSGPLTLNGGTLDATASFTSDATTTLGANGGTIEVGTAANTLTLTSEVSGGGGFVKTGSGTLNLNCHNFYNGTTDIQTGTVAVGADGDYYSLGNIGTVDIEQNGTLDLNGQSVNIGPLMGSGIVTSSTGGGTSYLTLYTTGATTFSGTITNGSGQVEVVMAGSGTQTLSGTNNSYTSATVADTGQLVLAAGCVLGNTPIWVYGGATLSPEPTSGSSGTVVAGSSVSGSAGATLTLQKNSILNMGLTVGNFDLDQESNFTSQALSITTSTLNFGLSSAGCAQMIVTKGAGVGGTNTIDIVPQSATLALGIQPIITAFGGIGGTGTFVLAANDVYSTNGSEYSLALTSTSTAEKVNVELVEAADPAGRDHAADAPDGHSYRNCELYGGGQRLSRSHRAVGVQHGQRPLQRRAQRGRLQRCHQRHVGGHRSPIDDEWL